MSLSVEPSAAPLRGTLRVPGDKSVSHRAILFSAMAEGVSDLSGLLDSADVRSTIGAVSALGARVELQLDAAGGLGGTVTGWGASGPTSPLADVDCGNSGTTARLLPGVVAGWPGVVATLVGDDSLSKRPMRRVSEPLSRMGAQLEAPDGHLPMTSFRRDSVGAGLYRPGCKCPGEDRDSAGGSSCRRADDRARACCEPGSHRASAARVRSAGGA